MTPFLSLIWRNVRRTRRRTLLTVFSIATSLCVLSVVLALTFGLFLEQGSSGGETRLAVRNRASLTLPIPEASAKTIEKIPGVTAVVLSSWFNGTFSQRNDPNNYFPRYATQPDKLLAMRTELAMPEEQKRAFRTDRAAAIVSRTLAAKLHLSLGSRVFVKGDIYPVNLDLKVRGIYDTPRPEDNLYFNRDYLEQGLPAARRGKAGLVTVQVARPELMAVVAKTIDETFSNSAVPTRTEPQSMFEVGFLSFLGDFKRFLLYISIAVAFAILLMTSTTIALSVQERTAEVGVLKTLGFKRIELTAMIYGESLLMTIAGAALGCWFGSLICSAVQSGQAMMPRLAGVAMTPTVLALSMGIALAIGTLSSVFPAWFFSRIPITQALKSCD